MNEAKTTSIVLTGVGGQGILLASEIVAQAAVLTGFDVKTNEVHGMAQRGGSVIAQIRYSEDVYSPLVADGEATVLLALERAEGLQFHRYLRPDGLAVVSSQMIVPVSVSSGTAVYPDDVEDRLRTTYPRLVYIDAAKIAGELGNAKAANVVLIGAMSTALDLPAESWEEAIRACVNYRYVDINIAAFKAGCHLE
jgi:indolepyruvate ferredoxin oxidoreductase, beta subunit